MDDKDQAAQQVQSNPKNNDKLIHPLTVDKSSSEEMPMKKMFLIFGLVILAGIASGFIGSYLKGAMGGGSSSSSSTNSKAKVVETAGIADKKTFKDSAEGTLKDGGHESGEGSFHLDRPGGEDQTAYLTSSTVDLSKYVGKKIRVHGETFDAQHVGWLMGVGYVEVLGK